MPPPERPCAMLAVVSIAVALEALNQDSMSETRVMSAKRHLSTVANSLYIQ
jgi:hypothetical protein